MSIGSRRRCASRPGHPRAGQPFNLETWQVAIIGDTLTHRETLLCIARKNAKSTLIAVLALAHLAGPLRRAGWRCGVLSANRDQRADGRRDPGSRTLSGTPTGTPASCGSSRQRARIESLQAAVVAVGLGEAALLRRRQRVGKVHVA